MERSLLYGLSYEESQIRPDTGEENGSYARMLPKVHFVTPPIIAGWNLALRFILELCALAGLGIASWKLTPVPLNWMAAIGIPAAALVIWGVFNVEGDTSRSGNAPIPVPGWIRLVIEILILVGAAVVLLLSGNRLFAFTYIALLLIHYAASWRRIVWLLNHS